MGRKILFVTTDQQRYDALGCNGGTAEPFAATASGGTRLMGWPIRRPEPAAAR
jgi:hypothetical protein